MSTAREGDHVADERCGHGGIVVAAGSPLYPGAGLT
mgnify:CR=1 FL=1